MHHTASRLSVSARKLSVAMGRPAPHQPERRRLQRHSRPLLNGLLSGYTSSLVGQLAWLSPRPIWSVEREGVGAAGRRHGRQAAGRVVAVGMVHGGRAGKAPSPLLSPRDRDCCPARTRTTTRPSTRCGGLETRPDCPRRERAPAAKARRRASRPQSLETESHGLSTPGCTVALGAWPEFGAIGALSFARLDQRDGLGAGQGRRWVSSRRRRRARSVVAC